MGVLGVTAVYIKEVQISFRLGGSRSIKVAVPFRGGGVRGSRNLGGKLPFCLPPLNDRLPRAVKSFLNICNFPSYSVRPSQKFLDPLLRALTASLVHRIVS